MTERILGPAGSPKRRRRRRYLFLPVLLVAAVALMFVAGAQAVHGEAFQLDGDVLASTTTTVNNTTQTVDWDSLFDANGAELPSPANFGQKSFDKDFLNNGTDFITSDTSTFATGSKDTLPIADWQCNRDNNVNSKIDVLNAYAVEYTDPVSGDEFLYFGLERNTNTGTADVGFWFLQKPVNCESPGGAVDFSGEHTDGDLLVVSEYSGGGTVSTINVFRWNGDDATGSLSEDPVAEGVDCRSTTIDPNDEACGAANRVAITTPWLTAAKILNPDVGHDLPIAQFFEGGVNLTQSDLEGCFTTFIADTRSSAETTATLFDFSRGQLGECNISVTTTPSQTTRVLGSPDPITDTADISGSTAGDPTPTGTVTFFLCSPSQSTSSGCPSGSGTQVGSAVTLGACTPAVAGHACATSANAASLITVLGTYCFRAVYDPGSDPNYQGKGGSFTSASECFTVTGTAGLSTAQKWVPNDTATLTGDANLNGTLTFTLYNDGTCGTTGSAVYSKSITVTNAASGSTFSTDNTTTVVVVDASEGSYSWKVHYDDNVLSDPVDECETTTISITD